MTAESSMVFPMESGRLRRSYDRSGGGGMLAPDPPMVANRAKGDSNK